MLDQSWVGDEQGKDEEDVPYLRHPCLFILGGLLWDSDTPLSVNDDLPLVGNDVNERGEVEEDWRLRRNSREKVWKSSNL